MKCECILFVLRESFFPLLCLPAAAEPCTTLIVLKVCHVKTKWAILRFYFISVLSIFFSLISLENIKVVFNEFAFEATLSRVELNLYSCFSSILYICFSLFFWPYLFLVLRTLHFYCRDFTPTLNIFNGTYFSLWFAKFTSF